MFVYMYVWLTTLLDELSATLLQSKSIIPLLSALSNVHITTVNKYVCMYVR